MKEVNLLSISQAVASLNKQSLQGYTDYLEISPSDGEKQCIAGLVSILDVPFRPVSIYEGFYFGYTIPQISKEFDLLRFGESTTVNIELKTKSSKEKVLKQLKKNKYYLSFLQTQNHFFTFIAEENIIYSISENDDLIIESPQKVAEVLAGQNRKIVKNIDSLFNPSNYLVSPFNSTDAFINGHYFLTDHQDEIKRAILTDLERPNTSFISIVGKAGTGKTLLTYDIVKQLQPAKEKEILLIHCGKLNEGHFELKDKYGWRIIPAQFLKHKVLPSVFLIVVDEAQRIYPTQLETIIKKVESVCGNCIFSYDEQQWLREWERDNEIERKILDRVNPQKYLLTEKIRTNKEIANFIKGLFDKTRPIPKEPRSNIEVLFFKTTHPAKEFMRHKSDNGRKGDKLHSLYP